MVAKDHPSSPRPACAGMTTFTLSVRIADRGLGYLQAAVANLDRQWLHC